MRHLARTLGIRTLWFLVEVIFAVGIVGGGVIVSPIVFGEFEKHAPEELISRPVEEPLPDPFPNDLTAVGPPALRLSAEARGR